MDPLLEPFTFNGLTIKNRVITTPHAPLGFNTREGLPTERYLAYLEEKAIGGFGMVMFGGSSYVAPDSVSFFESIYACNPSVVESYRELSERLHRHGAKAMVQISHLGRRADDRADPWLPTVAPSAIRERAHRAYPKVMEEFDFPRIIESYARAARYAKDGGLDGVEIAALSGHLPDSFFAPRANRRTDRYGGSVENRTRFIIEVVAAIRAEVGRDWRVGIRMPGEESSAEGLSVPECLEITGYLSATGHFDFFDVMYGSGFTHRELGQQIPSAGTPLGERLPLARAIRDAVKEPVFHAGRIADVATARYALREELVDLVGMTRASIADPHVVRKVEAGHEARIRPCVGASHCLSGNQMLCIHNPATGRESYIPQLTTPAPHRLRVVVVGGGPAGLEAARVSAERGHDVTLFEASSQVGGSVIPMTRSNRQSEKRSIVEWLSLEAKHAGAQILLNRYVDEQEVLALEPDVIIVATGGQPDLEVPDGGSGLVRSSVDVLSQAPPTDVHVVIYDGHGGEQALVVAEHLIEGDRNTVDIVTPDEALGHDIGHTILPGYKHRLLSAGVSVLADTELREVSGRPGELVVTLRNTMTDEVMHRRAGMVVVEQGTLALDDVYQALKPHSANGGAMDLEAFSRGLPQPAEAGATMPRLYRIGDAVAHRGVHTAIFDARRLCMNL